VCLLAIQRGALGLVYPELNHTLELAHFKDIPPVHKMIAKERTHHLYLPHAYNFPNIDAAIVQLKYSKNEAHVYLIQVTVAKDHKDSESKFFLTQWQQWKTMLAGNGFKRVYPKFIWINRKEPRMEVIREKIKSTRNQNIIVMHAHDSVGVGIGMLDPRLLEVMGKRMS